MLADIFGEQLGTDIPVLYGGSVNPQNTVEMISQQHLDGLFIGRAAWQAEGFIAIVSLVENYIREMTL